MKSCYETDRIKNLKPTTDGKYVCVWLTLYDNLGIKDVGCPYRGETLNIGNPPVCVVGCSYPRENIPK